MRKRLLFAYALITFLFGARLAAWGDEPEGKGAIRQQLKEKIKERIAGAAGKESDAKKPPAAEGETKRAAASQARELTSGGQKRTYRLHTPPGMESGKSLPLVIVLHGLGGNGLITEALTKMDEVSDKNHFLVAYPDGLNKMWQFWTRDEHRPGGKASAGIAGVDDVGYIRDLIDALVKEGLVDAKRVYCTGISNGGFFTNRLACDLGDKLSAVAPVSGTIPKRMAEELKPKRPIPVMYFHGTEDKIVAIDGKDFFSKREFSLSADGLVEFWVKQNKAAAENNTDELPDTAHDGTKVRKHTHAAGTANAPVIYYEIVGGGHTWAGGAFQPEVMLGKASKNVKASEVMWEFFSQYTLP